MPRFHIYPAGWVAINIVLFVGTMLIMLNLDLSRSIWGWIMPLCLAALVLCIGALVRQK